MALRPSFTDLLATDANCAARSVAGEHGCSSIHGAHDAKSSDEARARRRLEAQESQEVKSRRSAGSLDVMLTHVSNSFADIPEALDKDDDAAKAADEEPAEKHTEMDEATPDIKTDETPSDQPTDEAAEDDGGPSTAGLAGDAAFAQAVQQSLNNTGEEVAALRTALSECWTLCNTLAGLSSSHRQRTFQFAGRQKQQEEAWRSCWRLCQQLYDNKDEDHTSQVIPTLELCRDFCQSLFEARQKVDEASDSVLRVSFELNNHLYNTHDRDLPEAFNERTLDFYITICHRLMKQRTSLPQETDALLRACWSLAEMLFNLRQNAREDKLPDEELLGSAIQSCWELCDLFREGWTQIRPERGTPRPSQTTFPSNTTVTTMQSSSVPSRSETRASHPSHGSRSDTRSNSSTLSSRHYHDARSLPPETPTTIFDDVNSATSSPDSNVPNILVLGPSSTGSGSIRGGTHHERWSSNASVLSGYSESATSTRSSRSGSTATAGGEDAHLLRLRYLLLKAGTHTGFVRNGGQQLPTFVKSLPNNAFGTLPWQMKVLSFYKKLVTNDKSMMTVHKLPTRVIGGAEMAKSVKWLGTSEQWAWMRDLYRLVFGFGIDEVVGRGGSFQV